MGNCPLGDSREAGDCDKNCKYEIGNVIRIHPIFLHMTVNLLAAFVIIGMYLYIEIEMKSSFIYVSYLHSIERGGWVLMGGLSIFGAPRELGGL